jgi:hypothetical protein
MAQYYYTDKDGTRHCTTTETTSYTIENGSKYCETIEEGGDHTQSKMRVLGTPVMGSGRG